MNFTESAFGEAALEWLKDMGFSILFANDIAHENSLVRLRGRISQTKLMRGEVRVKEEAMYD